MRYSAAAACALLAFLSVATASAQDETVPGDISVPYPTLENLSIEWEISGDDDEDGTVAVRYRAVGADSWTDGPPLVRVPAGSNEGHSWGNRHAGSIFDLTPGTSYEIELTLTDPDGGDATQVVMGNTRPIPVVSDEARVIDVTPGSVGSAVSAAEPGDVLLLGPGTYPSIYFSVSGEAGRPIVLRGTSVEEVVVEGEIRMDSLEHIWIEDLTVEGQIKFNSAEGIVVQRCFIDAVGETGDGIVSFAEGSTNGYFADNVIVGQTEWTEAALGADGDNVGDGIVVTGPGNVIAYNRISGFRDCISFLEGSGAVNQVSVDIIGNDLSVCADDAVEADFAMGNVRVMRNRIVDSFVGLSSQPSLGGPTWFIRNVQYNAAYNPFKLNRGSVGDIVLHNTVVKSGDALGIYAGAPVSRALFRNNLFIGGTGGRELNGWSNGSGRVLQVADADATCSFDYDGFGSVGTGLFTGRLGDTRFNSFEELTTQTSEVNAVVVDMSVFAADVAFPEDAIAGHSHPDLRPADGGAAIDQGQTLVGINDDYSGTAPDLGAYELGDPLPQYGPRTDAPAICGNAEVEAGEDCDDGNRTGGDGCDPECTVESGPGDMDADVGVPMDAGGDAAMDVSDDTMDVGAPDTTEDGGTDVSVDAVEDDAGEDTAVQGDVGGMDVGGDSGDAQSGDSSGGDSGCGCATAADGRSPLWLALAGLVAVLMRRRGRR